jgi:Fur family peroxide stress response transcriptional regulator
MAHTTAHHSDDLAQRLADSGLRNTPQRELVYRSILARRDHPTAEEVFARTKAEMPTISLATVYNCLETLIDCRLVRAVHFERAPTRYCPNLVPHAHFHDAKTGLTHDVDLPPHILAALKKLLPSGYTADTIDITYHGHANASSESDRSA